MRVDFRGVNVRVAEHTLHHLYGNSTSQTYGCGEGVASAVGGQLLSQVHLFAENRQLPVVANIAPVWQPEVIFCQDVEHDGEQHDGVSLVGLLSVVVNQPVPLHLLTLREVDVEQVDVGQPGVAAHEEAVLHLAAFLTLRLVCDEAVELFTSEEHALLAPALHDVQAVVGVRCDDLAHDGLPDDRLDCVVNLCDGGVGHQV